MQRLPAEILTLYAELLQQLTALEARRSIGHAAGSFVTKTIKGREYHYFQYSQPGTGHKQIYLGPRSAQLDDMVRRHASEGADVERDLSTVRRLSAELRAGGAATTDAASARVLAALADAAVFRLGGMLVGTHAFVAIGNMLGVRWEGGLLRTDDVDIAAERRLAIAAPAVKADIPAALETLEMGFLPVPGLSPAQPSTSFKVRGRSLQVDLLTPTVGGQRGVVAIPRFGAAAEALPFLDYLLEEPVPAAIVDGGGVLVAVPHPARFALHKLLVSRLRPVSFQTKADKDLRQAAELICTLEEDRPGDLSRARRALERRGERWTRALARGLDALTRRHPDVATLVTRKR